MRKIQRMKKDDWIPKTFDSIRTNYDFILNVFVIVPLMIFFGVTIQLQKASKIPYFGILLFGTFVLLTSLHVNKVVDLFHQIHHHQKLKPGIAFVCYGIALLTIFLYLNSYFRKLEEK